jgi:hypothetical protein
MILSICIPSYNHLLHMQEIVDSFSKSKSNECELVITDNGSKNDINDVVCTDDPRVKIIKREVVVNGPENMGTCIEYGKGKYRLMIIDKDFIDGQFIDRFVKVLKDNPGVAGGKCQLNCNDTDTAYEIIDCRNNKDIKKTADFFYTENHPTGYLYSAESIEAENKALVNFSDRWNPFNEDMLIARCATLGPMISYKSPLVYSLLTRPRKCAEKSGTYLKKNGNIFFEPAPRIQQMRLNIQHLETLQISKFQQKQILKLIYRNTFVAVTTGYKSIISQPFLCQHYGIECRRVRIGEMLGYIRDLNKDFINFEKAEISKSIRICIIGEFYFTIPFKIFRSVFRRFICKLSNSKTIIANDTDVCINRWNIELS